MWVGKSRCGGPVLTVAKMICFALDSSEQSPFPKRSKAHADRKNNGDLRLALVDFTKIARMPRALRGDEWHPLIPSPLRLCHNASSRPSRAKRDASRDPGRVWLCRTFTGFRISPALDGLVRNDGSGELWLSFQGGGDIFWKILEVPTFGRRDSLFFDRRIKHYLTSLNILKNPKVTAVIKVWRE